MNELICKKPALCALILMLLAASATRDAQALENNLHFSGALVSEPCNLEPQDSELSVSFGSVVEKYLYLNTRTKSVPFTINLKDCDTRLGDKVVLTFKGTENGALPGLLAVTGSATGIAIGMETSDGTALPFNQPTPEYTLTNGANSLVLQAYVQGEPEAIAQQKITPGDFTAAATFELAYP